MNLPLFIARRTAHDKSSSRNVMTHVAATAIAVSTAVMILSLAVVFGFKRQITRLVASVAADVTVTDIRSLRASETRPIHDTGEVRGIILSVEGVTGITPYVSRGGVIRSDRDMGGVLLKGVGPDYDWAVWSGNIVDGRLPEFGVDRRKEVLLSRSCAGRLGVSAGDRVELMFVEEDGSVRRDVFKVCGIYGAGIDGGQASLAMTDIRNVRRINGWTDNCISGYEVRTDDFASAGATAARIDDALIERYEGEDNLAAVGAQDLYAEIFAWLGTHDVNATVIITIMFVVALFNLITALLIMVLERTRTIGILKSLGMDNGAIRRIFVGRAAMLVGRGVLWGNVVGIGLALIQMYLHPVSIDPEGYFVSEVPVSLGAGWIAGLDIALAAAIVALSAVATSIVSRISPAEALRYE